jgi:hypothetical protein
VFNTGQASLNITSVISSDPHYIVVPASAIVLGGGSQSFIVTFAPTAPGTTSGTITFTHNASGSPSTINVSGTARLLVTSYSPTFGTIDSTVTITGTNFDAAPINNTVYHLSHGGRIDGVLAAILRCYLSQQ